MSLVEQNKIDITAEDVKLNVQPAPAFKNSGKVSNSGKPLRKTNANFCVKRCPKCKRAFENVDNRSLYLEDFNMPGLEEQKCRGCV